MRTEIDVNELPARLNEVLALANAGQEVVVVANGSPRARLTPMEAPCTVDVNSPRKLGLRPGAIILAP